MKWTRVSAGNYTASQNGHDLRIELDDTATPLWFVYDNGRFGNQRPTLKAAKLLGEQYAEEATEMEIRETWKVSYRHMRGYRVSRTFDTREGAQEFIDNNAMVYPLPDVEMTKVEDEATEEAGSHD